MFGHFVSWCFWGALDGFCGALLDEDRHRIEKLFLVQSLALGFLIWLWVKKKTPKKPQVLVYFSFNR